MISLKANIKSGILIILPGVTKPSSCGYQVFTSYLFSTLLETEPRNSQAAYALPGLLVGIATLRSQPSPQKLRRKQAKTVWQICFHGDFK